MSEHDLSETDTTPAQPRRGFRRNRFGRGISTDIDGHAPRPGEGWANIWSAVKVWSSKAWATVKAFDWEGNGRLVVFSLPPGCLIVSSCFRRLAGHCSSLQS